MPFLSTCFLNKVMFRICCSKLFCVKAILKIFVQFTEKHLSWSLFLGKVAGLQTIALPKNRLLFHWYLLVNLLKFFRTTFHGTPTSSCFTLCQERIPYQSYQRRLKVNFLRLVCGVPMIHLHRIVDLLANKFATKTVLLECMLKPLSRVNLINESLKKFTESCTTGPQKHLGSKTLEKSTKKGIISKKQGLLETKLLLIKGPSFRCLL